MADVASQAVQEFLGSPDIFTFDLAESPAFAQLQDHAKHSHVHQLLVIFLEGDVQVLHVRVLGSTTIVLGAFGECERCAIVV